MKVRFFTEQQTEYSIHMIDDELKVADVVDLLASVLDAVPTEREIRVILVRNLEGVVLITVDIGKSDVV